MLDRLQNMLAHLEKLPPETQEEVLDYMEALIEALEQDTARGGTRENLPVFPQTETCRDPAFDWIDLSGSWQDLPPTLLEELERMRHG